MEALPFTAGITLAFICLPLFSSSIGIGLASTGTLAVCGMLCFRLKRMSSDGLPAHRIRIAVMLLMFSAGTFVCLSSGTMGERLHGPSPVREFAERCGENLKKGIDAIPYSDNGNRALTKALLTGDKSGIGKDVNEVFRKSGASHILALSGMHLGIIWLILNRLLSFFGNSRTAVGARSVLIVGISGFFTLMTGASPSIVRAFLFIAINETARRTCRTGSSIHTLATALMLQLAFAPENIASVGFQLSYAAMCGIFFLFPTLKSWFPKPSEGGVPIMGRIWNSAALSISCQIFTTPLVWYHFGTFPQYFLIANLIAIPISTVCMVSGIIMIFMNITGFCPEFIIAAHERCLEALQGTLSVIAAM